MSTTMTKSAAYQAGYEAGLNGWMSKADRKTRVAELAGTDDAQSRVFAQAMQDFVDGYKSGEADREQRAHAAEMASLAPYLAESRQMAERDNVRDDCDSEAQYEQHVIDFARQLRDEDEDAEAARQEREEAIEQSIAEASHRLAIRNQVIERAEAAGWRETWRNGGYNGHGSLYLHLTRESDGEVVEVRVSDHPHPHGRGGMIQNPGLDTVETCHDQSDVDIVVNGCADVDFTELDERLKKSSV